MKMTNKSKIKMVFFDMEGVLFDIEFIGNDRRVGVSSWALLLDKIGLFQEYERTKQKFSNGDFSSYLDWSNEVCKVLKKYKLTKDKFTEVISSKPLMKGAKETLKELKNRGYKTAVISGGFKEIVEKVRKLFNLDSATASCELLFNKSGYLKNWKLIPCDFEDKGKYFEKVSRQFGFLPSECAHIGDEINDISIFQRAGLSIAFNCFKDEIKKSVDIVIDKKDLREILPFFPKIS